MRKRSRAPTESLDFLCRAVSGLCSVHSGAALLGLSGCGSSVPRHICGCHTEGTSLYINKTRLCPHGANSQVCRIYELWRHGCLHLDLKGCCRHLLQRLSYHRKFLLDQCQVELCGQGFPKDTRTLEPSAWDTTLRKLQAQDSNLRADAWTELSKVIETGLPEVLRPNSHPSVSGRWIMESMKIILKAGLIVVCFAVFWASVVTITSFFKNFFDNYFFLKW